MPGFFVSVPVNPGAGSIPALLIQPSHRRIVRLILPVHQAASPRLSGIAQNRESRTCPRYSRGHAEGLARGGRSKQCDYGKRHDKTFDFHCCSPFQLYRVLGYLCIIGFLIHPSDQRLTTAVFREPFIGSTVTPYDVSYCA